MLPGAEPGAEGGGVLMGAELGGAGGAGGAERHEHDEKGAELGVLEKGAELGVLEFGAEGGGLG